MHHKQKNSHFLLIALEELFNDQCLRSELDCIQFLQDTSILPDYILMNASKNDNEGTFGVFWRCTKRKKLVRQNALYPVWK